MEFADESVVTYDRAAASGLTACLDRHPGLVFEGHSTDYQPKERLREMVEDGIAILRLAPALTFALREGLFALEQIEQELYRVRDFPPSHFRAVLEQAMLEDSSQWAGLPWRHRAKALCQGVQLFGPRAVLPDEREGARRGGTAPEKLDAAPVPPALLSQYLPYSMPAYMPGPCPRARPTCSSTAWATASTIICTLCWRINNGSC